MFSLIFCQDIPKEFIAEPVLIDSFNWTVAFDAIYLIRISVILLEHKELDKENYVSVSVEFSWVQVHKTDQVFKCKVPFWVEVQFPKWKSLLFKLLLTEFIGQTGFKEFQRLSQKWTEQRNFFSGFTCQ